MKLYYTPGACSLSPHLVAEELGLPLTLEKVDLASHKTESGRDFYAINPKGYVPALELDDGSVLTEGPAIVQYLGDRKPGNALVPAAGTMPRYRLMEWLNFVTAEIHKPMGAMFNPKLPAEARQQNLDRLGQRFDYLSKILDRQDFLLGKDFSAADAYLFVVLNWSGMLKVDLSKWPVLQKFQGRVGGRPAAQKTLKAEGLIK